MRSERAQKPFFLTPGTAHLTPERGFTLVELVFVMVILAVLLSFSAPQFAKTAQRLRVEQTAFEMTQLMRYAHERAVTQGLQIDWVWDAENRRARIEAVASTAAPPPDDPSRAFEKRFLQGALVSAEIAVLPLRAGEAVDRVSFFADGSSSPSMTVEISHGTQVYLISIDATTGQPTLSTRTAAR